MRRYLLVILMFVTLTSIWLHADFALTVVYLIAGVYLISTWWSRRSLQSLQFSRRFTDRLFYGEKTTISLTVHNPTSLPVPWLQLRESIPVQVNLESPFARVVMLGAHASQEFHYSIEGRRRGYYSLGPLDVRSGDLFGLGDENQVSVPAGSLTVYPKIIPLVQVGLPSRAPIGTLRHRQPLFEDPSRVRGKREYIIGDSLRRIDWKATAISGRLQVKLLEPSIALDTVIFLNLNSNEYEARTRAYTSELAIVVAASLANWIISNRQACGLVANALNEGGDQSGALVVPARGGRAHLMRILDVLARVQMGETQPASNRLGRELVNLPWGTTLVLICGRLDDELFDSLFQARRKGLEIVLVPCGSFPGFAQARQKAEYFGFSFYPILDERDLDIWRK